MSKVSKRVDKATSRLVVRQPFFAALLLRLNIVSNPAVKTFATDGKNLFYNEAFAEQLRDDEIEGVLCHEVMHNCYLHSYRKKNRDHERWNIAADFTINPQVLESGLSLPQGALISDAYKGKSEEQVYAMLPLDPPQGGVGGKQGESSGKSQSKGQGSSPGKPGAGKPQSGQGKPDPAGGNGSQPSEEPLGQSMGEVLDAVGDEAQQQEDQEKWRVAVIQAATIAKQQGKLPGFAKELIDSIKHPKTSWKEHLRNYLTAAAKQDYSWTRPNRRFVPHGVIMPSMHNHGAGTFILAADTSGSVGSWQDRFFGHVFSIIEDLNPERVIFTQIDAKVQHWQELEQGDKPELRVRGLGGTDFRDLWKRIEQENVTPDAVVFLTDGFATFGDEPPYPVIWGCTTDTEIPFGTVVKIED